MFIHRKTASRLCWQACETALFAAFCFFFAAPHLAIAQAQQFHFSMDADRFYDAAPMLLHYQINNSHWVYEMRITSERKNASWLELRLYDADGNLVPTQANESANTPFYRDGIPVRPDNPRPSQGGFCIMPGGYTEGIVLLNDRFPKLKPGKYHLSIRASLMAAQSRPPDAALSPSQKAMAAKEASSVLPSVGTMRGGTVIRFTVLPMDAAALEAEATALRKQFLSGQPQEAIKALQTLMAWPKSSASSVWRSIVKDQRFDKTRQELFASEVYEAAYKGDSNAISLLGYLTWEAKLRNERLILLTARSRGDAKVQKQVEALFAAHGEEIPSNPLIISD